jgi:hypothetical protein
MGDCFDHHLPVAKAVYVFFLKLLIYPFSQRREKGSLVSIDKFDTSIHKK